MDTKADPYVAVERKRQALDTDNAPPPEPQKHFFIYDPHHGDPATIGFIPGFLDLHGNPLVQPSLGPTNHPLCSWVFRAGEINEIPETEQQLLNFVKTNRLFRRARHSELGKDRQDGTQTAPAPTADLSGGTEGRNAHANVARLLQRA
jgi:hypothetical protein